MNSLKSYPGHLLLYIVGAFDFISQLPAAGVLAPYAPYITAAGVAAGALHHAYSAGAGNGTSGIPSAIVTSAKLMILAVVVGVGVSLTGCATLTKLEGNPTAVTAVDAAVTIAASVAIQQKDTDPKVWATRAKEIKLIALELQGVNSAGNATLATLAADLQPQIAKLGPADSLAVNSLVLALQPLLNTQIAANPAVGTTQVAVANILTAVLTACTAYGA